MLSDIEYEFLVLMCILMSVKWKFKAQESVFSVVERSRKGDISMIISLEASLEVETSPQNQNEFKSFNQDLISLKINVIVE